VLTLVYYSSTDAVAPLRSSAPAVGENETVVTPYPPYLDIAAAPRRASESGRRWARATSGGARAPRDEYLYHHDCLARCDYKSNYAHPHPDYERDSEEEGG
jgi:hypothetical protein